MSEPQHQARPRPKAIHQHLRHRQIILNGKGRMMAVLLLKVIAQRGGIQVKAKVGLLSLLEAQVEGRDQCRRLRYLLPLAQGAHRL